MSRFSIDFVIEGDVLKLNVKLPRTNGFFKQIKDNDLVDEGIKICRTLNMLTSGQLNEQIQHSVLTSKSTGLADFIHRGLDDGYEEDGPIVDPRGVFN